MHPNDLPLDFPSKLVMSNALGDLLGSTSRADLPSPGMVSTPSRMIHRHSWMTSLGAFSPSDSRLRNFHVPSSLLASFSAASSARAGRTRALRMIPERQSDLLVIMVGTPR